VKGEGWVGGGDRGIVGGPGKEGGRGRGGVVGGGKAEFGGRGWGRGKMLEILWGGGGCGCGGWRAWEEKGGKGGAEREEGGGGGGRRGRCRVRGGDEWGRKVGGG